MYSKPMCTSSEYSLHCVKSVKCEECVEYVYSVCSMGGVCVVWVECVCILMEGVECVSLCV